MEHAFIREELKSNQSPYARFYLTLKAHKLKPGQMVDHLKSHPIISCPSSLLHGLGIWVDHKLQEVVQKTTSCFKNTLELKKQLLELHLPPNACLFTADTMSMYTNIPTYTALNLIGKYLTQHQQKCNGDYPHDAVRVGLCLIMTLNIFTIGDLTFKQLNGTAMGTPLAPPYATIYYGIHEEKFPPHHSQHIIYYQRFIDDVIGIWYPNKNPQLDALECNAFKNKMSAFPGLTWEFSEPSTTVDLMDMTITINKSNKIETTLLEKDLTYTYTFPHTLFTHQGYSQGLYTAHCFEFLLFVLLKMTDYSEQRFFSKCLIARGYKGNEIRGLFHKAIARAKTYNGPTVDDDTDHNNVILHLPFHPNDPASFHIQAARHTHIVKPQWKMPLEHMKNPKTKENCNIKRMIITHKRPMNLGNLLSHRDLATAPPPPPPPPPISSYLYD